MSISGNSYTIHGVKVMFPWKPYPSQFSMMDKIIKGIENRQNCLLESPTGSGKSLALLCSALAWQRAERAKVLEDEECGSKGGGCMCTCKKVEKSDTGEVSPHFQKPALASIPQATSTAQGTSSHPLVIDDDDDFKTSNTKYRTPSTGKRPHHNISFEESPPGEWKIEVEKQRTCSPCTCGAAENKKERSIPKIYFGTRTHKQIAQITKEFGRTAYSDTRMSILASRENTCIDHEVSTMSNKNEECKLKLDTTGCRFKDRVVGRVTHGNLKLNGLNEAWDLEDLVDFCKMKGVSACPYYGTRELLEDADIVFCPYNYLIDPLIRKSMSLVVKNQIIILDEAHNMEDCSREAGSVTTTSKQIHEAIDDIQKMINYNQKPNEHGEMERMLKSLQLIIDQTEDHFDRVEFDSANKVWSGMDMRARLQQAGLGPENLDSLVASFTAIKPDEDKEPKRQRGGGAVEVKLKSATLTTLEGVFLALTFMYKDNMKYFDDYRLAVTRQMFYQRQNTNDTWLSKRRRGGPKKSAHIYSVHFWCMNPAVCFEHLGEKARSIILTSGTLSPMDSFQSELSVPFPIQLEANHVIGKSQVWVGTISQGPRGTKLLGTYQVSETFSYQDEVGELLLNVCEVIPYGVLCFMPSYKYIEKMRRRWQDTGLLERIEVSKKVMIEPRKGGEEDFDQMMKDFYTVISHQENGGDDDNNITGALFLAVCRGKVSEGMDFTDNNARAVITVGIPFPNFKDVQVELKKAYNNQHHEKRGLLRGGDWYEIQAYRALNQALGRCIRHRNDWGALILVDERFGKNPQRYIKGLSKWVRQRVQHFQTFSQARASLDRYTKERKEMPATHDFSIMSSQSPGTSTPMTGDRQQSGFKPPFLRGSATPASTCPTPEVVRQVQKSASPPLNAGNPLQNQETSPEVDPQILECVINAQNNAAIQGNGQQLLFEKDGKSIVFNIGAGTYDSAVVITKYVVALLMGSATLNSAPSNNQQVAQKPNKQKLSQFLHGDGPSQVLTDVTGQSHAADETIHAGNIISQHAKLFATQAGTGDEIMEFEPPNASTQMAGHTQIQCNNTRGKAVKTPKSVLEFQNSSEKKPAVKKCSLSEKLKKKCDAEKLAAGNDNSVFQFVSDLKAREKENSTPRFGGVCSRSNSPLLFESDGEVDASIEKVLSEINADIPADIDQFDSGLTKNPVVKGSDAVTTVSDSPPMDLSSFNTSVTKTPGKQPLFKKKANNENNVTAGESDTTFTGEKRIRNSRLSMSRRKSNDQLAKTTIENVKTEPDKQQTLEGWVKTEVLNGCHVSNHDESSNQGLSVEEEGELNVRRSRRKRKRNVRLTMNKKSNARRGVDFLDDIDTTVTVKKEEESSMTCKCCGKKITSNTNFQSKSVIPDYLLSQLEELGRIGSSFKVFKERSVLSQENISRCVHQQKGHPPLNSLYSSEDNAVYQILRCRNNTWLGVEVVMLSDNHHPSLERGEVWLLADALESK